MRTGSISAIPNEVMVAHAQAGAGRGHLNLGVQFCKTGLMFTSKQSLGMWERVGANLFAFADSSTWWIADWLVYGESTFQDRYEEAVKRTSLSYQTLRNYTWVARRFPLPRRRHGVSFSHHLEVVALEQAEQDYWLRKAEELRWSRNRLRTELRGSLLTRKGVTGSQAGGPAKEVADRPAATGSPTASTLLHLQLSADDMAKFERAAKGEREHVETWAAEALRRAAAGF